MTEDTTLLNHPLSIVTILAVILGFLAMAIDKFFYFMRGVNKTTPMDKMAGAFSSLERTLSDISQNLKLMNQNLEHHRNISEKNHDAIKDSLDRLERRVDGGR